jgi:hypothetical protein
MIYGDPREITTEGELSSMSGDSIVLELEHRPSLSELDALPESHSAFALFTVALAIACSIAVVDLFTFHLNWPALYFVPLLIVEQVGRRRALWPAAAVLVVLTFAGYFFGFHAPGHRAVWDMLDARLVNRVLVAAAIVLVTAILHAGLLERERRRRRGIWPHDPDGAAYEQVVLSISRLVSPLIAALLVLVLMISDAQASAEYNVAILFWLPLVILARPRSRTLLWSGLAILVAATMLGLQTGDAPPDRTVMNDLLLNRALVCAAMIGVAAILHHNIARGRRASSIRS